MLCLAVAVMAGLWLGLPDAAFAQASPTPPTPAATLTGCSEYPGLANRVAMCLRDAINNASSRYYEQFYPFIRNTVAGFLTFTIVVLGVMASFGMLEKPSRDVFIFLVKMSFVVGFVSQSYFIYMQVIGAMDSLGGAVVQYTPTTSNSASGLEYSTCLKNLTEFKDANGVTMPSNATWVGMDCVIDSVIGIKIPQTTTLSNDNIKAASDYAFNRKTDPSRTGLSRGLFNFFFASMGTSIMGVMLGIVGIIFVYTLLWLIAKSLFTYIAGYIGVAFLVVFAPIFIPLILFRQTKDYFMHWVKLVLSFALQPIIILVFMNFSIVAVDLAVFSGDYSVTYRLAGNASRVDRFDLNQYLDSKGVLIKKPAIAAEMRNTANLSSNVQKDLGGLVNFRAVIDCSKAKIMQDAKAKADCEASFPLKLWRDSIDWEKLAAARAEQGPVVTPPAGEPGSLETQRARQIAREVFAAVVFAALTTCIMKALLGIVSMVATDLVGDSYQSPNLYNSVSRSRSMGSSLSGIGGRVRGMFGG